MRRRSFLKSALLSTALSNSTACALLDSGQRANRPLNILVLGGTNFVGPAVVEAAVANGHSVTLFNRGITRPYLFPALEKLVGDRTVGAPGLRALTGNRRWDAVVDVWPEASAQVADTARLLEKRADYYFFVSSIAVYRDFSRPNITESSSLRGDEVGYGGEKVRSEELLQRRFADRYGVARCSSILGPKDPGSSLHFWLRSASKRSNVIGPGSGVDPVQFVDVRDVAQWIVGCVETQRTGIYNVAGNSIPFRRFLETCVDVTGRNADARWLPEAFLREQRVEPFMDLPLWIPEHEDPGFFRISSEKARSVGFRGRPIDATLRAAWRWYQSAFFKDTVFPHNGWGLSDEVHDRVLASWEKRQASQ